MRKKTEKKDQVEHDKTNKMNQEKVSGKQESRKVAKEDKREALQAYTPAQCGIGLA